MLGACLPLVAWELAYLHLGQDSDVRSPRHKKVQVLSSILPIDASFTDILVTLQDVFRQQDAWLFADRGFFRVH